MAFLQLTGSRSNALAGDDPAQTEHRPVAQLAIGRALHLHGLPRNNRPLNSSRSSSKRAEALVLESTSGNGECFPHQRTTPERQQGRWCGTRMRPFR